MTIIVRTRDGLSDFYEDATKAERDYNGYLAVYDGSGLAATYVPGEWVSIVRDLKPERQES